jgi:large subunit ribosomal protein L21
MADTPTYVVNGKRVDPDGKPVGEKEVVSSSEATDTDLNDKTVSELKEMASDRGIEGASSMKKDELIAVLEGK